jgi:D-alanyl-D-alanine carboxypeptidase
VSSEQRFKSSEKINKLFIKFIIFFFVIVFLVSCKKNIATINREIEVNEFNHYAAMLSTALTNANLPQSMQAKIHESTTTDPEFIIELLNILQGDPYMRILVDKQNVLDPDYVPDDLVQLTEKTYRINRNDMMLRSGAEASLIEMAGAARAEGLTLLASSAYRSYQYQEQVYARNVRSMGQEEADKVSARPGHSQHQLGLVIDFGSITDEFADTKEGKWLSANASRFGWSLSYPKGYEEITGYSWESWHYRYVGRDLASFINNYFDGIQQYALKFIHEWEKQSK